MCRRVQGSQIFKQNWFISIHSRVILILLIWVSSALGVGQVGGGVSWVNNYSLYGFRSVQRYWIFKQNQTISISSELIEFWCFGLPAALGNRQVGGGIWGHGRVSPHTCTHMYTLKSYKKLQMTANMEASMFIMFTTCLMCMCVCMCAHVCMHGTPPHTHTHPHPHICHPPGGGPLELIKIL